MPRKQKQYVRDPEEEMKGGAIPTQMLVEHRRSYGGSICSICKHHIDVIDSSDDESSSPEENVRGGGLLKDIRTESGKVKRASKKASKSVGKYVTDPTGLASDVVNYGLPAATSALLAAPASALGGPAAGVVASAIGAKLGTMAADKIANSTQLENRTGGGVKRKSRFEKGSEAAKEHMRMLREKRVKKMLA